MDNDTDNKSLDGLKFPVEENLGDPDSVYHDLQKLQELKKAEFTDWLITESLKGTFSPNKETASVPPPVDGFLNGFPLKDYQQKLFKDILFLEPKSYQSKLVPVRRINKDGTVTLRYDYNPSWHVVSDPTPKKKPEPLYKGQVERMGNTPKRTKSKRKLRK